MNTLLDGHEIILEAFSDDQNSKMFVIEKDRISYPLSNRYTYMLYSF